MTISLIGLHRYHARLLSSLIEVVKVENILKVLILIFLRKPRINKKSVSINYQEIRS